MGRILDVESRNSLITYNSYYLSFMAENRSINIAFGVTNLEKCILLMNDVVLCMWLFTINYRD